MLITNVTSYIFNLVIFSIIAVWFGYKILNLKIPEGKFLRKDTFYDWFTYLGIFAIITQLSYVYAPKRIFSNASHHVIEHLGFAFENHLSLASSQNPETAVWDDKLGDLSINYNPNKKSFVLNGESFFEPIYVRKKGETSLLNPVINTPIVKNLEIQLSDTLGITLSIGTKDSLYSLSTQFNHKSYGPFLVPINKPLNNGYSLGGMLSRASVDAPQIATIIAALDSVYLLRRKFDKDGKSGYNDNPLLLFPSWSFIQNNPIVKIDGQQVAIPHTNKIDIELDPETTFYVGLWNTQTKIYRVNAKIDNSGELLISFPNQRYLKQLDKPEETLFLTSSSDEIANNQLVSGFYYPLIENEKNQNHFAATLTYNEGSTIEQMNFKVVNLDQNDLKKTNQIIYVAGDTIQLKTKGAIAGNNNTKWLFKIKDLKAENPLKFWHLIGFSFLVVLMIFMSIYLTPRNKQTKTEYIIYLFLITTLTIRSVLLWRVSTFVPTEEISESVYLNLTKVMFGNFKMGVWFTIGFFVCVWIWKLFAAKITNFSTKILLKTSTIFGRKSFLLLGLYVIPLITKNLGIDQLERIGAVFLPLCVYIFNEFWFLYKLNQDKQSSVINDNYRILAVSNWVCCFSYLAISDAGFSIVFFLSTLIYWLIQLLTFPDYLKGRGNSWFAKLKHWRFVVPILILVTFIFAAPYLLSFVFLKTTWIIIGISIGLLIYAGIIFFQKQSFFKSKTVKISITGILVFIAVATIVFKDNIIEKIQDKNYVRYRAEVLIKTPDEIIQGEQFKFNLGNDSKLLRAAQNQWFINYYYENGVSGWLKPFINLVKGKYFQLMPSFQRGSPYSTQIADLVTVRYVIGEHSQLIIINLLILMIILILSAIDADTHFNFYSKIRVIILCLLFTVGFFIWMAATNRIVFLGQDFPLLSLNSMLTLLFTFFILFFSIAFGKLANQQENIVSFNNLGRNIFKKVIRWVLFIAIVLISVREHDFSEKRFNLSATISNLKQDFTDLNEDFARFQKDNNTLNVPLAKLLVDFDNTIQSNKEKLFKNSFSRSAYEAYMKILKNSNSSQNLIHIKRGGDGMYEFAINKLYYDVSSPDLFSEAWRGNLISSNSPNTFSLLNRENGQQFTINPKQNYGSLEQELSNANTANFANNHNIRMTVVPSGWTVDSLPKILVSSTWGQQTFNQSNFSIKENGEIFRSESSPYATILNPEDIIQFVPEGKSKPITLQYKHKESLYLAKNVWLNGRYQFFYPLKNKFIWGYHFANLVKSKFDEESEKQTQNLKITIDPDLTEKIYDRAEQYFSGEKSKEASEQARAFNLVALDSDGKIRALSDFKQGIPFKFDPNKISEYKERFDNYYLNAQSDVERLIFGNRCLMRSDNGPASTFKPILYAAVSSQYNFNWQSLTFGGLERREKEGFIEKINNEDFQVRKFGGRNVKFTLSSSHFMNHTNIEYISNSTNSYNSMITFLGSLDKTQINGVKRYANGLSNDSTFLVRGRSPKEEENFPDFTINNQSYRINKFPTRWDNDKSLMAKGLWENFNFPVRMEQLKNQEGKNLQNIAYDLDSVGFTKSRSANKLWSFPEPSHLYLIDRNDLQKAIVQCATGADPINTTPYKMAEMAGTLFAFNKDFKGTVLADARQKYRTFGVDNTWEDADKLSSFYANNLFEGMNKALMEGGTAHGLVGIFLAKTYPQYHFYAKTGTISGNRYGGMRDKHLMLIISKNQLNGKELTARDLKNNRFYVLYFSFYKQSTSAEWGGATEVLRDMVKIVIESNGFQDFINHE